jgi:hypothetical protein
MEYLIKMGEPGLKQHPLIYGKQYKIYKEGRCLETAVYTDDKFHGDVFLKKVVLNGQECLEVFAEIDEWEFV